MSLRQENIRTSDPLYLFERDRRERQAMEDFSLNLLKALWREHPVIMRHQFMAGRAVRRP